VFEVAFAPAAALELVEAYDWYEAELPGLGVRFQAEIDSTLVRMTANPLQFPAVLRGARRALLRRFPYMLFFTIEDNTLLVIACFHVSRDPRMWRKRT
jgi:plasmid stabilization system protein ParE